MKLAQVNKLYAKLTPLEQATPVIEAAAKHDESEADAIMEQVEESITLPPMQITACAYTL